MSYLFLYNNIYHGKRWCVVSFEIQCCSTGLFLFLEGFRIFYTMDNVKGARISWKIS